MKALKLSVVLLAIAGAVIALAAVAPDMDQGPRWMQGGMWVIPKSQASKTTTANRITNVQRCVAIYDFPSMPATGSNSGCIDSFATTCTGVVFGDQTFTGVDQVPPLLNAPIPTAYVSAADTIKVRACNPSNDGGAIDWPDASYTITWVH